ncbi:hypothetical protein SAMD00019534_057760 [Acytostelium subglobosum LB1]|uniref:hypothetical protein n=1 Tax=Acytostelium subglobosum LB1 TaxID=1410327 RepID=UPI000644861E|nr:hypothetical protein SAMD00019534_057760 [Acytostelium subglobosum LB1]GAM22601.1 hypothetical protein SAMD00019534_057760 [Acytostelium subglobosum LB1]|eukprot:XP_012754721.1 hypothetical protein SAMD00019534_057760 [Acytostelium subglobosum LB1]
MSTNNSDEIANAKGKVIVAKSLFDQGDYTSCCELLATCLTTMSSIYGEESIELAPIYLKYGDALLLSYKTNESDVFGSKPGDDSDEEDVEPTTTTTTTTTTTSTSSTTTEDAPHLEEIEDGGVAASAAAPSSSSDITKDPRFAALQKKAQEDIETLELAWEIAELARVIYQKDAKESNNHRFKELSEAHILIGEISIELDNLDGALQEYEYALELRKKHDKDDLRSHAQVLFFIALVYQLKNEMKLSENAYKQALANLTTCLETLQSMAEPPVDDIQELKNVIAETQLKMVEVTPIDTSNEPVPKELQNMAVPETLSISTSASDKLPPTPVKHFGTFGKATRKKAPEAKETTTETSSTETPTATAPATKKKRTLESLMSGEAATFATTQSQAKTQEDKKQRTD